MKQSALILLLLFCCVYSSMSQEVPDRWEYSGTGRKTNAQAKFTIVPQKIVSESSKNNNLSFTLDRNMISWSGVKDNETFYVFLDANDVKINPKEWVECTTFSSSPSTFLQMKKEGTQSPLKFTIKEGFPGGNISVELTFKLNRPSDPPSSKDIIPFAASDQKPTHLFVYKNVPAIQKKSEQEEIKVKDVVANLEKKYQDNIHKISDTYTKSEAESNKLEEQFNKAVKSDIKTLTDIKNGNSNLVDKLKNNQSLIDSIYLKAKGITATGSYAARVADIITGIDKEKARYKKLISKINTTNAKVISQINIEKEIQAKVEIENLTEAYLELIGTMNPLTKELEDILKLFDDISTKYSNGAITDDELNSLIDKFSAANEKHLGFKAKMPDLESRYTILGISVPAISDLKSKCEKLIVDHNVLVKSIDSVKNGLEKPKEESSVALIVSIIIICLVAAGVIFFFYSKRRKKVLEKQETEIEEKAISDIEIVVELGDEEENRGLLKTKLSNENLLDFVETDLSILWNNSYVAKCYIHKTAVNEIYEVCRKEQKDRQNRAPEVGGFLLGNYVKTGQGEEKYHVYITDFLKPSNLEYQDVYQIKFGVESMQELDDLLSANKEQALVGWFHTHPGHRPFLSTADITIHNGTFYENWQVAIVVDPYHEMETGIFTRYYSPETKRSSINNNENKCWFDWNHLKNSTNKTTTSEEIKKISNLPNVIEETYFRPFDLREMWGGDSFVNHVYIGHSVIFDLEEAKCNSEERMNIAGFLSGYYDETEPKSGKFDIYVNKISSEPNQSTIGLLGVSNLTLTELENVILIQSKKLKETWQIMLVMSDNRQMLSFLSKKSDREINYGNETGHITLDELVRWTQKL